ncbi:hypothetical protein [Agrobacterium sp.]|uniref:hypothetical protein n=1 Tax=Agrobacterium sp. TaxID=361 RepID=UPI0028AA0B3E|nr:hypothetical protein [Agrobacterium sp.]
MRLSRKTVVISCGVLLLSGAAGLAAVYIGTEKLLGPSYRSVNGLECQAVQTVTIKKNGTFWIRQFIRTNGGDGTDRLKTALRVAKAIYGKQHPDLVQVSVLDTNGPQLRSEMRGRAIAAQAVYIPDMAKIPEGTDGKQYSGFYYDGVPNAQGYFYGLRIDLPLEDMEGIVHSLSDTSGCEGGVAESTEGAHGKTDGHGAPAEKAAEPSHGGQSEGGHGEPSAEAPPPADEQLLTSTPEHDSVSIFSLAYLKSLIFGKGTVTAEAAEQGHEPAADAPAAHASEAEKPHAQAEPSH